MSCEQSCLGQAPADNERYCSIACRVPKTRCQCKNDGNFRIFILNIWLRYSFQNIMANEKIIMIHLIIIKLHLIIIKIKLLSRNSVLCLSTIANHLWYVTKDWIVPWLGNLNVYVEASELSWWRVWNILWRLLRGCVKQGKRVVFVPNFNEKLLMNFEQIKLNSILKYV